MHTRRIRSQHSGRVEACERLGRLGDGEGDLAGRAEKLFQKERPQTAYGVSRCRKIDRSVASVVQPSGCGRIPAIIMLPPIIDIIEP